MHKALRTTLKIKAQIRQCLITSAGDVCVGSWARIGDSRVAVGPGRKGVGDSQVLVGRCTRYKAASKDKTKKRRVATEPVKHRGWTLSRQ